MNGSHMLRYHFLIPVGLFLVLLVAGVSVGTALVVGMMSGCMAMMFMRIGHSSGTEENDRATDQERPHRP